MITKIYVHNYRCFENFNLDLSGDPSHLLLGMNGAGKSTVGFVLEFFQNIGRGVSRVGDLVRSRDFANGHTASPMRLEIEVKLDDKIFFYSIAFELPQKFLELRVVEEELTVDKNTIFSRKLAEVKMGNGAEFGIDWHIVALPIIQDRPMQGNISIFKNWLRSILILRPVPSLFQSVTDGDAYDLAAINPQGVDVGPWFTEMVIAAPETYSVISEYLKEVMPDFKKITNDISIKTSRDLSFHFNRDDLSLVLTLDQLSDGEKIFFLYALVIAANATRRSLLCFWDEPDNFLAPAEVGQSVMALRRSFKKSGQLLITSHAPEAIRRFSEENTFYFSRKSRMEPTNCKTVRYMRESGDYKGNFIDALMRGDVAGGTNN